MRPQQIVSVRSSCYGEELGTFSLDMAGGSWTRHGDWCLPFEGQAHYDDDLAACVGIHAIYNEETETSTPTSAPAMFQKSAAPRRRRPPPGRLLRRG